MVSDESPKSPDSYGRRTISLDTSCLPALGTTGGISVTSPTKPSLRVGTSTAVTDSSFLIGRQQQGGPMEHGTLTADALIRQVQQRNAMNPFDAIDMDVCSNASVASMSSNPSIHSKPSADGTMSAGPVYTISAGPVNQQQSQQFRQQQKQAKSALGYVHAQQHAVPQNLYVVVNPASPMHSHASTPSSGADGGLKNAAPAASNGTAQFVPNGDSAGVLLGVQQLEQQQANWEARREAEIRVASEPAQLVVPQSTSYDEGRTASNPVTIDNMANIVVQVSSFRFFVITVSYTWFLLNPIPLMNCPSC